MDHVLLNSLLTATALAIACSLLSVIVVLRRWAFIGEGISHSGLGGAGTALIVMLLFPKLDLPWLTTVIVVVFCLATAVAIGALSRRRGVNVDTAIGIFLVASLAWGFFARQIYMNRHNGLVPQMFDSLLFGQVLSLSGQSTAAAVSISLAVAVIVIALWKEILAYAFDPGLAQTSGVRTGFIHYLLMIIVALVIVIGIRIAGSVLMTALLVLPGATALLLSRKMKFVLAISMVTALIGAVGGLLVSTRFSYIAGPLIVLIMFLEFVIAYAWKNFVGNGIPLD